MQIKRYLFLYHPAFFFFSGPHTIFVLARKWYGGAPSARPTQKNLRFLGGSSGVLRLLEQLLLNFCNLDVDALTHKPD